MTARARPRVEVRVVADPVPDAVPDGSGRGPADRSGEADRPPSGPTETRSEPSRWPRRRWLVPAVLVALTAALLGSEALEGRRADQRAERLAAIPGAVGDLSVPPVAAWQSAPAYVLGPGPAGLVASVPVRVSTAVVTLDVRDGTTRWALPLSAPGPEWCSDVVIDGVLCWAGGGVGSRRGEVVVLDPGTGEEIGRLAEVLVGAGAVGTEHGLVLVRTTADGDELVAIDPATGAASWTLPLPDRYVGSLVAVEVVAVGDLVALLGPRTYVVDPRTGAVLTEAEGRWAVVAVPEGFAMRFAPRRWRVYDAGGRAQGEVPGQPVEPEMTDGSVPDVLVVTTGTRHVAVDRAGRELWSLPDDDGLLALRREGALVVVTEDAVESFDLVTGASRWRWEAADLRPGSGAVSDGRLVVVVSQTGVRWEGHAIDLDTGELRWSAPLPVQRAAIEFVLPGLVPVIEAVDGQAYTHAPYREVVWWDLPAAD